MKTALVHDYLAQCGGAERVVAALSEIYTDAPIYTSVFDRKSTLKCFLDADVRTSFMQKWPISTKAFHKIGAGFYPLAFEQFDLSGYDLVLSSSSSYAKGVITGPQTCHICYCHTPARFAWRQHGYFPDNLILRLAYPFLAGLISRLRAWDMASAQRVDYFIANSNNVAHRIEKYYRRGVAAVIYPPIDTSRYRIALSEEVGSDFLVVSRMVSYKRIDLAIRTCNHLGLGLRIVGSGPELPRLKAIAGPTIRFLGQLDDADTAREFARCRALIVPGEEDFGMTPLEANASGRPVIAFAKGGALESVDDGKTGVLFDEQTEESLAAALEAVQYLENTPAAIRAHAEKFDVSVFQRRIRQFVENAMEDYALATHSVIAPDNWGELPSANGHSYKTHAPI